MKVAVVLLLLPTTMARFSKGLSRRQLLLSSSVIGGGAASSSSPCAASDLIRFQADDLSFGFELPPTWVPATAPEDERTSAGHLIAVRAQKMDGTASLQAIVDGGSRGRSYGSSLSDLGPLETVAQRLLQEELLDDNAADFAALASSGRTGGLGGTAYYVVRYQMGGRPAIAKIAVAQQRLYCIKVRAEKDQAKAGFFERESSVRTDMETIADSFSVVAVNSPCLMRSNAGKVPGADACKVLRP